jgi:peptidoglycan/LPS O-acetylase OafA/YrhL
MGTRASRSTTIDRLRPRVDLIDQTSRFRLGRRPALDGIRGLAVIAVVFAHFELASGFGQGGMVGVDIFFCLSGFLITTLLLEEHGAAGKINLAAFYRRRAARLLPGMLIFVASTVVIVWVTGIDRSTTIPVVPVVLAYVENWWAAAGRPAGALGHMWSLAVEEQFYLVWPAVVILTLRHSRAALAAIAVLGSLLAIIDRERACLNGATCVYRVYMSTDTRMDQILLGALLAIGCQSGVLDRITRRVASLVGWSSLAVLVVFCCSATSWSSHFYDTTGMTVTAILTCVLIGSALASTDGALLKLLSWRPLTAIGLVSYGIYLWNELFLVLIRDGTGIGQYPRAVLIVMLTAAASAFSWRFVERPILNRARAGRGLRAAAESPRPGSNSELPPELLPVDSDVLR